MPTESAAANSSSGVATPVPGLRTVIPATNVARRAAFSVEAPALDGIDTVEAYTEWAKGLLTPMPDARYELRSLAVDDERQSAVGYAVFHGTHTGEGGPIPPTGQSVATDYAYVLQFDGDKIRHMTKIWNDGFALQQLGWM